MKPLPGWAKAGCIILALIFLFGVLLVMCSASIAIPNFLAAQTRAMVARTMSDMRNIATALDTYKNDTGTYPQWTLTNPPLTTPVAYLSFLPADPFAPKGADGEAALLSFRTSEDEFVIWSVGPDKESQISGAGDLDGTYEELLRKSYDVTNGTASPGDIFRTSLEPKR